MSKYRGIGLMGAGAVAAAIGWPTVKTMPITVIIGVVCFVWGAWRFIQAKKSN